MVNHIGQKLGNYRLTRLLGTGGFAEVYLGKHIHLDTYAAIKVLHTQLMEDDIEVFRREAYMVAHLLHPNIIHVFDFGIEDKTPFLVMDYAPNGTLRHRHPKGTRLALQTVNVYVQQIALALQYAHERWLVHRDVKPENILLQADGTILLSDFGIAKVLEQNALASLQTQQAGTPAYMAPEQSQGKPCPASDQYALAIIAYEWLAGRLPFQGSYAEVIMQHWFGVPPSLQTLRPNAPVQVEQVILRALAKTPEERFSTIQRFAEALQTALHKSSSMTKLTDKDALLELHSGSPRRSRMPSAPTIVSPLRNRRLAGRTLGIMVLCLVLLASLVGRGIWTVLAQQHSPTSQYATVTVQTAPFATADLTAYNTAIASNGVQFGFDARHTHINPYEYNLSPSNIMHLVQVWTAHTSEAVKSSPTVANGVIYIGSEDHKLYVFRADGCGQATCAPLWTALTDNWVTSSPAVANGVVYVGSHDNKLYAFKADGCGQATCIPLWTAHTGSLVSSSPAVANGVVYVGSHDDKLYAFKADGCGQITCMPLWTAHTGDMIESSPAVANGVVYIGSDDNKLYAFKADGCGQPTCTPLWTAHTSGEVFSSPAVANGIVYVGSDDHNLYAFKAGGCGQTTCVPLWTAHTSDGILSSPAVANGVVYVGSDDHNLYAFKAGGCGQATCAALWTAPTGGRVHSSPAVANGVVYVGSDDDKLYAFKTDDCGQPTCIPLWTAHTSGEVFSSPAVANGVVYVGSDDGKLYAFHL